MKTPSKVWNRASWKGRESINNLANFDSTSSFFFFFFLQWPETFTSDQHEGKHFARFSIRTVN